jgi:hypothetical protein
MLAPDTMNIRYHLRELEMQYRATTPAARRTQMRIAAAAARGARKGRGKRWDLASIGVAVLFVVAFVACGNVAVRSAAAAGQHWIDIAQH